MNVLDLIGRPWAVPCNPPQTYDCFELCVEVRRRYGKETPSHVNRNDRKPSDRDYLKNAPAEWGKLLLPSIGSMAVMGGGKHVGVYLGRDKIIHCQFNAGTRIDSMVNIGRSPLGSDITFWELKNA